MGAALKYACPSTMAKIAEFCPDMSGIELDMFSFCPDGMCQVLSSQLGIMHPFFSSSPITSGFPMDIDRFLNSVNFSFPWHCCLFWGFFEGTQGKVQFNFEA